MKMAGPLPERTATGTGLDSGTGKHEGSTMGKGKDARIVELEDRVRTLEVEFDK